MPCLARNILKTTRTDRIHKPQGLAMAQDQGLVAIKTLDIQVSRADIRVNIAIMEHSKRTEAMGLIQVMEAMEVNKDTAATWHNGVMVAMGLNKDTAATWHNRVMVAMGLNKAAAAMEALKVMMAIELNKDMAAVAAMETRRGMADMEAIVVHIVVDRADTSTCQVCLPMEFVRYE